VSKARAEIPEDVLAELEAEAMRRAEKVTTWVAFDFRAWFESASVDDMPGLCQSAYLHLLIAQLLQGSLPASVAKLSKRLDNRNVATHWGTLEPLFPVGEDGRRRNSRMSDARDVAVRASARHIVGGLRSRWLATSRPASCPASCPASSSTYPSPSPSLPVSPSGDTNSVESIDPPTRIEAEIIDTLARSADGCVVRVVLDAGWRVRQLRELRLLISSGGLSDSRNPDAAKVGPCSPAVVLEVVQALAGMPLLSPRGGPFSWRPQIGSIRKLREKFPKVAQSIAEERGRPASGTRPSNADQSVENARQVAEMLDGGPPNRTLPGDFHA